MCGLKTLSCQDDRCSIDVAVAVPFPFSLGGQPGSDGAALGSKLLGLGTSPFSSRALAVRAESPGAPWGCPRSGRRGVSGLP